MSSTQLYRAVNDSDQDETSDWYEYDPRLASVGVLARAGVSYRPPRFFSLVGVRICAVVLTSSWLITLLGLFLTWMMWPLPNSYTSLPDISKVPFSTDLGGQVHRNFFTAGSVTCATFYFLTVLGERILRSQRVMSEATDEHVLWVAVGALDVLAAMLASTSLALPCLVESVRAHAELHVALLAFFVVAVSVSGLLQTAEVHHLWHEHPDRHALQAATLLKAVFLGGATVAAISSWGMYTIYHEDAMYSVDSYRSINASAALQWSSCFLLTGYFATLILDVWPSARHRPLAHPAHATAQGVHTIYLAGDVQSRFGNLRGAPCFQGADYVPLNAVHSSEMRAAEMGSGIWHGVR